MKKGKTSPIQGFKTAKVIYGTVDSVEFKSVYLNIQTWVEPIKESENWTRVVLNLSRAIKHIVFDNLNKELFEDKFIVDLDLRSSGLSVGKKSFFNLEINFYLKGTENDFKSKVLKEELKTLASKILQEKICSYDYFDFYLRKNIKENNLMLQS